MTSRAILLSILSAILLLSCPAGYSQHAGTRTPSTYEIVDRKADAYLRYSLGRILELQGMLTDALVQYRAAAAADRGECAVERAVARVLFALGRFDEARPAAESALRDCPESPEAAALLAAVALSEGDPVFAESVLQEPASHQESPTELTLLLAQSLMAQDRLEDAEQVLRDRGESDSLSPRLAYLHARTLLAMERTQEASEKLLAAHALDPENVVVLELSVSLLTELGRETEAVPMLEELLRTSGARPHHALALARLHARLGDDESAMEAATRGLRRFGETPGLLRAVGSMHYDAGETEQALDAYERALELDPESVQALNFVAYTLADLDIDAERAVELARRAAELDPDNGIVRDTLGWAYFRTGRLDEAVAELRRAIELGESDPVIYEHLGDALEAQGHIAEAIEAWEKALGADPVSESPARKIERALSRTESAVEAEGD